MIIGVTNLKGGVGKTTVSQNLAVCLAHMGYKVCLVDTDTNQNCLSWVAARPDDLPNILTVSLPESKALTQALKRFSADNDFVIIDGTPNLSEMTTRIMLDSDILIVPILTSAHDIRAINQFIDRYNQAKEFKEDIPMYFFLNRYDESLNVHRAIKTLITQFEIPMMTAKFKERVAYIESAIDGKGAYEHNDPKSKKEVIEFVTELLDIAKSLNFIETHGEAKV